MVLAAVLVLTPSTLYARQASSRVTANADSQRTGHKSYPEGLTAEQKLLNVAKGVLRHTEVKRSSNGRGRCQTYAGNVDQIALAARHLAEDVTAYLQQRERMPAEQYEYHLRQAAALKYPQQERTAEFTMRLEATIQRKVQTFGEEQQVRQYEASLRKELARRHPDMTEQQRLEYNQRILDLIAERREEMARQQQLAQTPAALSRDQGKGIER